MTAPTQTDLLEWVGNTAPLLEAKRETNPRRLRRLWDNGSYRVKDALRDRGYHRGTGTFLPDLDPGGLWLRVLDVQKGRLAGALDREAIECFCQEWGDIRNWLRTWEEEATGYEAHLWGRRSTDPCVVTTQVHINADGDLVVKREPAPEYRKTTRQLLEVSVRHQSCVKSPRFYAVKATARSSIVEAFTAWTVL